MAAFRASIIVLFAFAWAAASDPPAADAQPSLQSRYKRVQAQVNRLDTKAERLTEQYNLARVQLKQLQTEIGRVRVRLAAAEARLEEAKRSLAALLVAAYKGGDRDTVAFLFGGASLGEWTAMVELHQRVDDAFQEAVAAITEARDEIATDRAKLEQAERDVQQRKDELARKRREIVAELAVRRRLVAKLSERIRLLEAAKRAAQQQLALAAARWIRADIKANRDDQGARLRDHIALDSLNQLGVPYKWGGASPEAGFDCSGLLTYLWAHHGVALPHYAASQFAMGPYVDRDSLKIGDLVFYHELGHMGMYIGRGYMIHAPHTGSFVQIVPISEPWYESSWVGATRPGPP